MHSKNYNLIPLSIDQGLNRVPIGTAGGYIRLLEAPAAANVQIHLNEQNADGIPLKTYHAIEATNIEKIFVSCNAVPGEKITVVQANTAKDFKMVTPASDVKLSSLGSYESVALDQLDKIINPYDVLNSTVIHGSTQSTTVTNILNVELDCDKIILNIFESKMQSNSNGWYCRYFASVSIDGNFIASSRSYTGDGNTDSNELCNFVIENCRGKTLSIDAAVTDDNHEVSYHIEKLNLKA